jgi:hypothetical protein
VADVQLEQRVVVRRVGERIAARAAVLQLEVEVLSGEELQALVGRQLQLHQHHVVDQLFQLLHAARQRLHRHLSCRANFLGLDHQVRQGLGHTEQGLAFGDFMGLQSVLLVFSMIDPAFEHLTLARTAGAVAATVGQGESLAQSGGEYGFVFIDDELMAAGLNRYLIGHDLKSFK